ncbi:hypothetical protein MMC17_008579 [Xylographa soralifera]|nr:hypothetical protein [Xylographa soralifera]
MNIATESDGESRTQVLWSHTADDGHNVGLIPGEVVYGHFDVQLKNEVIVKYYGLKKRDRSHLELWSQPIAETAPVQYDALVNILDLNFLIPHKIATKDSFSTIVGYGFDTFSQESKWYFCNWDQNYSHRNLTTFSDTAVPPAQALLSVSVSNDQSHIVRIFYGAQYPMSNKLRIDVLDLMRALFTGNISFKGNKPTLSQRFIIKCPARLESDYLLWFSADVNGDGIPDLVAYTSDKSNIEVSVIVFPGEKPTGGAASTLRFGEPVVSPITVPSEIGYLVIAEFMKPMYTARSSYAYPSSRNHKLSAGEDAMVTRDSSTDAAIMAFFDNYGVVGARLVAPVAPGSLRYELKGQNPAIPGQRAVFVGERPADWMGLDKKRQVMGIVSL